MTDNNYEILVNRLDEIGDSLNIISNKIDDLPLGHIRRERHDSKRIKKYISFDSEQYNWIEDNIKTLKFASFTHAVEWGLYVLKEKLEKGDY